MAALSVPAGTWAVFTTSGPAPEAIQYLWRYVFIEWFPSNPHRSRSVPETLRSPMSANGSKADAERRLPAERETYGAWNPSLAPNEQADSQPTSALGVNDPDITVG
ncbi:GyrI-like domain-containing protein [Saccharopolyspora sp. ID03-671]|uniref:GyrI-like domain-containing protein n=1 Tax=Saccharopolyspora sp. ID03-671 TaxID=3073066 RepID=UPI003243415D